MELQTCVSQKLPLSPFLSVMNHSPIFIVHKSALEITQLSNILITDDLFSSPIIVLSKQIIGDFLRQMYGLLVTLNVLILCSKLKNCISHNSH